jgi:YD repeat-containing protein
LPSLVKTYGSGDCVTSPSSYQNCAKPTSITDARSKVTNYAYFGWGGMKSELQPAPASGVARPLRLFDYIQKYAYVKNSSTGPLTPAASQIWLPDTDTSCQQSGSSDPPTCDTGAKVIVTKYEYGADGNANNLLLRAKIVDYGTGKLNLRTCYTYDNSGNKISETAPRGTSGGCS